MAFSVLYDPDETLNFVAPNKYEVRSAIATLKAAVIFSDFMNSGIEKMLCSSFQDHFCIGFFSSFSFKTCKVSVLLANRYLATSEAVSS